MPSEDIVPRYDITIVPSHETAKIARLGAAGYACVGVTSIPVTRLVFHRVTDSAFEVTEIRPALVLQRRRNGTGIEAEK